MAGVFKSVKGRSKFDVDVPGPNSKLVTNIRKTQLAKKAKNELPRNNHVLRGPGIPYTGQQHGPVNSGLPIQYIDIKYEDINLDDPITKLRVVTDEMWNVIQDLKAGRSDDPRDLIVASKTISDIIKNYLEIQKDLGLTKQNSAYLDTMRKQVQMIVLLVMNWSCECCATDLKQNLQQIILDHPIAEKKT